MTFLIDLWRICCKTSPREITKVGTVLTFAAGG